MHKTLKRVIDGRREAVTSGENIDWATAESLAFASLLDEGYNIRLSGQDSVRGTFSQRHSGITDQTTEKRYFPLNHLRDGQAHFEVIDSALSEEAVLGFEYGYSLADLGHRLTTIPNDVDMHKTLKRVMDGRREMITTGQNIDWATAESLAFGSLLLEGFPVRLSGQDSVRGTFSQRHSGVTDQTTEQRYFPLNNLREGQAHFEVIDSALSEEAVLGFEYG